MYCAADYKNEEEVGAALAEVFETGLVKREELFITTKASLICFIVISYWICLCFFFEIVVVGTDELLGWGFVAMELGSWTCC